MFNVIPKSSESPRNVRPYPEGLVCERKSPKASFNPRYAREHNHRGTYTEKLQCSKRTNVGEQLRSHRLSQYADISIVCP